VRTPERDVVESVQVSVDVFKAPLRTDILHRSTKHYLASLRQGTASAKTRAEVRGGGRKPHKQKGTGWARAGSIRSPLWRGGGVVFPPKPRDFSFDLPKKVRRYALRSALSVKLAQNRLDVWIELDIGTHRTAVLAELIRRHGWRSVLFVSEAPEVKETSDFARAAANLPLVEFVSVHKLTVYDVLKYERLVLSRDAALALDAYLKPQRLLGVIGAQPTPAPAPSQTEVQMN
jgi:large subunit ribosomal protein L4